MSRGLECGPTGSAVWEGWMEERRHLIMERDYYRCRANRLEAAEQKVRALEREVARLTVAVQDGAGTASE